MISALRRMVRLAFIALVGICLYFAITYKPYRILIPSIAPVTCVTDRLCLDDVSREAEAQRLTNDALSFVNREIGEIQNPPRIYFCASEPCSTYFGLEGTAGYAVGTLGIVIKPSGWKDHTLRHELIHHLQNDQLGTFGAYLTPKWFREGMAYSLSRDPRRPLNNTHGIEDFRKAFEVWYPTIAKENLWDEARKLDRND